MNNQKIIKDKISLFVKKYYLNKLYKGILLFLFVTISIFLIITISEYFSFFSSLFRTIVFYSYIVLSLLLSAFYLFHPLFKLLGLGKQIEKSEIADLIGSYFPEIEDKLLNNLGQIDLEIAQSIGISGLNTYYSLQKMDTFPYVRTSEIPDFE